MEKEGDRYVIVATICSWKWGGKRMHPALIPHLMWWKRCEILSSSMKGSLHLEQFELHLNALFQFPFYSHLRQGPHVQGRGNCLHTECQGCQLLPKNRWRRKQINKSGLRPLLRGGQHHHQCIEKAPPCHLSWWTPSKSCEHALYIHQWNRFWDPNVSFFPLLSHPTS